jgi:FkbM family methyltransferase
MRFTFVLFDLAELVRIHSLKIDGVLHLGAHTGEEARAYHRNRCGEVWWVEADPAIIPTLEAHVARWPNHHVINECVAEVSGAHRIFHRANNYQSSSLLPLGTHLIQSPEVRYVDEFTVTTRTVDYLADKHGIRANFLNSDLQGAELLALRGAESFLKNVDYIYTEINWTPLYQGCVLLPELDVWLGQRGFVRYDTKMAGNSGWGDCLFARPEALGLR